MFVTLPKVFESMRGGTFVGAMFFLLVLFAALTSSISLMEAVVSIIRDKFGVSRNKACFWTIVISIILGVPSSLGNGFWANIKIIGMDFLSFFDFVSNSVIMPIVAFFTCIFVGYVIKPKSIIEEVESSAKFTGKGLFTVVIKYIAPVCIVLILISSILEAMGILKI